MSGPASSHGGSPGRRVVSAVIFFPRGGSAHVARQLARQLPRYGWQVTLLAGSRSDRGHHFDAVRFYDDVDVHPVDYTEALGTEDPMGFQGGPGTAPMHPSFEDVPGAADRVFASLSEQELERQVSAWRRELERAGAADADVLHLHHLTPLNEAAARLAPGVPVVGQVHGTELLMLERIASGAPKSWRHADAWARRMRGWAARCAGILAAPGGIERAAQLLDLEPERFVATPNGFDPDRFRPREVDRLAHWRRHLVNEPQGWLPGQGAGSIAYRRDELEPFEEGTVLIYVGRFTEVKRLPMLIRAHGRARPRFRHRAPLVLLGGHPGEWEGQHPAEVVASEGAKDVFLAGWHGHGELPDFLNASDVVVLASAREQFGQVLVEGMACGRPPVATSSYGPSLIVDDGRSGWLVPRDDPDALADAMVEAVNDPGERARRGRAARQVALDLYSWPGIAERVAGAFEAATSSSPGRR